MSGGAFVAVLCAAWLAGVSAWLSIAPDSERRLRDLAPPVTAKASGRARLPAARFAALAAAVGALALLPWPWGVAGAVAGWLLVPRLLARLQTRGQVADARALARQAPVIADLLAATAASGATVARGVAAIGSAIGEPGASRLARVSAALKLGADPAEAFRLLLQDPALEPIAAAVARSMRTGAPLASVLAGIAEDLRRARAREVEMAARSAGVRAIVPLAACFLPAFMLLGVVPVVASLAMDVLG